MSSTPNTDEFYKIPKDLIELLINKYAPHQNCCDFCDRTHTLNEKCCMCKESKVRCGIKCRQLNLQICKFCHSRFNLCKQCIIKYGHYSHGRHTIRQIRGKIVDKWMCKQCQQIEPCTECKSIIECTPRCTIKKYN